MKLSYKRVAARLLLIFALALTLVLVLIATGCARPSTEQPAKERALREAQRGAGGISAVSGYMPRELDETHVQAGLQRAHRAHRDLPSELLPSQG